MLRLEDPRTIVLTVFVFALLFPDAMAPAGAEGSGWSVRVNGNLIDADGRGGIPRGAGRRTDLGFDVGAGLSVSGERRFGRRLGAEVGVLFGGAVDTRLEIVRGRVAGGVETLGFMPIIAGLDIHLWPGRRGDLYLGPLVAFIRYGDLRVTSDLGRVRVEVDEEVCLGAVLGLDVPVGAGGWFFNANLRYLAAEMRGAGNDEALRMDFDPLITGVGFGYRF